VYLNHLIAILTKQLQRVVRVIHYSCLLYLKSQCLLKTIVPLPLSKIHYCCYSTLAHCCLMSNVAVGVTDSYWGVAQSVFVIDS